MSLCLGPCGINKRAYLVPYGSAAYAEAHLIIAVLELSVLYR